MSMPGRQRSGLTLLEVVVATAIFLISVIAIAQLSNIGSERAMDVHLQTRTSMRCQAKLAEIIIGAEANTSGSYTNFTDDFDKDLQWRAEVSDAGPTGLKLAKVWVKAELSTGKVVESQLSQMYVDPSIRGTTFDQPNEPPSTTP